MNPLPRPPVGAADAPTLRFPERAGRRPRADDDPLPACHWDHCPSCGTALENLRCKYRCPRCFYFMSCSDFD